MNWVKIGGYILIIIPTLFVGVVIGFYLIQDYMIFLGEKLPNAHEYNFNNRHEELYFDLPDGNRINALLFRVDEPKGLIYYHHGNAGNLQSWGNYAGHFMRLGYDVLFYDYRGYGKSTGRIKQERQLHNDADFILKWIQEKHNYSKIVYYGNSLGTGIAAKLAMEHEPDALILETPYFNFWDLIHFHYPYLPTRLMSKYKLRTDHFIKLLNCPVMLFHGTDDDIVSYDSSERLSKLNENIKFTTIPNGVHNNLPDFQLYQDELYNFLKDL